MDLENSAKIWKVLRSPMSSDGLVVKDSCNSVNTLSGPSYKPLSKNPLEMEVVLQNIFGFLPLQDIKQCRLVCQTWNYVAEPCFRKLSRVSFNCQLAFPDINIADFTDTFSCSATQIPFTAFGLKNFDFFNRDPLSESFWRRCFQTTGFAIQDFKVYNIQVEYSIQFGYSALKTGLNITKLTIHSSEYNNYKIKFRIGDILNIQYLHLRKCCLELTTGIRISPTEIDLKDCQFLFPMNDNTRPLNEFIGFDNMKRCIIHYDEFNNLAALNLDLAGKAILELLDILDVIILNWETSNWEIATFVLGNRTIKRYPSNILIRVKELELKSVRLERIPSSVEKLTISDDLELPSTVVTCVPNLKHLKFNDRFNSTSCKFFRSLVALEINHYIHWISLKHISNNVRKLRLNAADIYLVKGEGIKILDKLVLFKLNEFPADILYKFKAREVVLCIDDDFDCTMNFMNNVDFLQFIKKQNKAIAIGPLNFELGNFEGSKFAKRVNEKSDYYLFARKRGRGIGKNQFDKMMEL